MQDVSVELDVEYELELLASEMEFMDIFQRRDENGVELPDWVAVQAAKSDAMFRRQVDQYKPSSPPPGKSPVTML